MEITEKLVREKFEFFNRQIFGGKLPMPRIGLSRARTFLGACTFKTRRGLLGKKTRYDFAIRISTMFDMSETEFEDTLIHEMIHYYIGVNQIEDTSAHGQKFRSMMADINSRFCRRCGSSAPAVSCDSRGESCRRQDWLQGIAAGCAKYSEVL